MAGVRWGDVALEQTPGVVWVFDRQLRITAFNRAAQAAAREVFGREPEPGTPILEFISPGHRASFEENAARCLAGEELVFRPSFTEASGSATAFEVSYRPLRGDDGAVVGCLLAMWMVGAHAGAEAAAQAGRIETATVLASGLAHDLRNILGVVQLELEMLADRAGLAAAELSPAREALDRGIELTRRLTQFAGGERMAKVRVDLRGAIEGAMGVLRGAAGRRARLVAELAEDLEVEVDVLQLERVLVNLVVNARDALAEPGPVLLRTYELRGGEVGWSGLDLGRRYAVITVRDPGEGMSAAVQERLFDPFFTTKAAGGGTGLGLASCWGIVRQHGGAMRVESSPGAGTTMMIALPLVERA